MKDDAPRHTGPDMSRSYRSNFRDGRSFASVAAGTNRPQQYVPPPPPPPPPLNTEPIPLSIGSVISDWLRCDCTLKRPSAWNILEKSLRLSSLRLNGGSKMVTKFERIAWIKIVEVPSEFWNNENFEKIASKFGKVMIPFEISGSSLDVSNGKVCICTESRNRINEERLITEGGRIFRIGVFEVDELWSPFNLPSTDAHVDSESETEDEEEDGISETIRQNSRDVELEDGEIGSELTTEMVPESKEGEADSGDDPMSVVGDPGEMGLHGKD
ncbi:hypothetical protein L1887_02597 [Cichorium endivia]|nr:hypothetical protein L1887_02597 [Cichorium endivia]